MLPSLSPFARGASMAHDPSPWMSVDAAATILSVSPVMLRRLLERSARRNASGLIEAAVDGIVARKVGRLWRVRLDEGWSAAS